MRPDVQVNGARRPAQCPAPSAQCASRSQPCPSASSPQVYISIACILATVGLAVSAITMNFTISSIKKAGRATAAAQALELS